jgi:hypothetical protein
MITIFGDDPNEDEDILLTPILFDALVFYHSG